MQINHVSVNMLDKFAKQHVDEVSVLFRKHWCTSRVEFW